MKLRTKYILFFGVFLVSIALGVAFYSQNVVGSIFTKQTTDNFRVIAEQTESAYMAFVEGMRVRVIDLAADPLLRTIMQKAVAAQDNPAQRARLNTEFTQYITDGEQSFDKTISLVELVNKDGIVIASTDSHRLGVDAGKEESRYRPDYFKNLLASSYGEASVNSLVDSGSAALPRSHVVARVFIPKVGGGMEPLGAELIVQFSNTAQMMAVLAGDGNNTAERQTSNALMQSYKTSSVYFVNSSRVMVTPIVSPGNIYDASSTVSKFVSRKVDTLPVGACLERGEEINQEYDNYQGVRVLGSSMCLEDHTLALVLEVNKDEIFGSLNSLIRGTTIGIILMFILGVLIVLLFVERPITRIDQLVVSLERAMKGDFSGTVNIDSNDETGKLAKMFNTMIESIRKSQKELQESKQELEEKAALLEKDLSEHEKQEKFLEESKRATLNLLEDSWKAKEKLEEEGSKLQTILASIGDGLVLVDFDYKIILVNIKAVEMFKASEPELLGKDLREVVNLYKNKTSVELKDWPVEQVIRTKNAVTTTVDENYSIATKRQEEPIAVALSIAPIVGKFSGIIIVLRDVTADRELDEAKSGFISVASHQLRTPLTSIRWYSEMLLSEDSGPLNDTQRDFMEEVHGGAERLYKTVDLLLSISRVEGGNINANRTPIDLEQFTKQILKELNPQISQKGLNLIVAPEESGPVVVWIDEIVLRQVILNILSNSVRYTNSGGFIKINWKFDDGKGVVIYTVNDNGIGIPESQRSRIFSKFFRAENARAEVPDGSGLGLALVKNLVTSWGGKIWFESDEGKGTTFFFTIPLKTNVA